MFDKKNDVKDCTYTISIVVFESIIGKYFKGQNMCGLSVSDLLYLAPRESDCWAVVVLISAACGPGLDTDALFTCPFPLLAPDELPLVNSDTVVVKLRYRENRRKDEISFFQ